MKKILAVVATVAALVFNPAVRAEAWMVRVARAPLVSVPTAQVTNPAALVGVPCVALAETMNRYGRVYQAGTQRRNVPNFMFAAELARTGKLGKLHTVHANTLAPGTKLDWLPAEPEPSKDVCDWDMWLGPCPWRPYNSKYISGGWRNHFDFHGGGILEWGSHTIDLCQWANDADKTVPVEYEPTPDGCNARYANGVKLVMRVNGWMGLGTSPARTDISYLALISNVGTAESRAWVYGCRGSV